MHRLLDVLLPFLLLFAAQPLTGAPAAAPCPEADAAVLRAFAATHPGFTSRPGRAGGGEIVVPEWAPLP